VKLAKASRLLTLFCHQNADPDSLCSAFALKALFEQTVPGTEVHISSPGGISAPTKHLIRNLGLAIPEKKPRSKIGVAVLVDTNNLGQLGADLSKEIIESSTPLVIVDHHHEHPEMKGRISVEIIDSTSSSTAEIVAQLYAIAGVSLEEKMAEALLAALFVETRYFTLATQRTFENAAKLAAARFRLLTARQAVSLRCRTVAAGRDHKWTSWPDFEAATVDLFSRIFSERSKRTMPVNHALAH